MKPNQSKAIKSVRERYLREYRNIHKDAERINFFKEIGKIAAAAGLPAWEKFAYGMSVSLGGEHETGLKAFEEAIALDSGFAYPWNGKGNILREQKSYDKALAAYKQATALDARFAYPWNGIGLVLEAQKRYDEAVTAYEKAIALDHKYASPWNGKGNVLCGQKRYEEALAAYEKAIAIDLGYAQPWSGKGIVLRRQKRYDEALEAFDKAIKLDPEFPHPWNGRGSILGEQERYDEALAAFKKAIALDSKEPVPYFNLGRIHWRQDMPTDAIKAFRRAIDLGLEPALKEVTESWIERADLMIGLENAGESEDARKQADRKSDKALVTELFGAIEGTLPDILEKKKEFKKQIYNSLAQSRVIGEAGVDDILIVLRDWNSFSPILRRELRDSGGRGPVDRRGGGYFLAWKGHGLVIDPGLDFVTQLYRKGLSIADVDTVIITHCHLDHTRDVESLVDLNYRYNKAMGYELDNPNFRQLQFYLCYTAFMKYSEYFKQSGCCQIPTQLDRSGNYHCQITPDIIVQAVPAEHLDINRRNNEAIGLVFVLQEHKIPVVRVGITSDTKWIESLSNSFKGCDVLIAHLGTIEIGEEEAAAAEKGEKAVTIDQGGFLKTDLKNHLGTKGCYRLLQAVEPRVFIIGEFGEELVETRFKIIKVFHQLRPIGTLLILGGDSNLAIGLGKELSVCCSHSECARSWSRIPLNEVRSVLGGDFLFQYTCPLHEIG